MVDLINHYANEQCTTEITHIGLEKEEDDEKKKKLDYRKLRGNYNVNLLMSGTKFIPGNRKTNAMHFIESFSRKIHDYTLWSEKQEEAEAMKICEGILLENRNVNIWNVPDWHSSCDEDNDSSEGDKDDQGEDEEEFFDEVAKLKDMIKDKPKLIFNPKKSTADEEQKLIRDSIEKRAEVMNFEVEDVQTRTLWEHEQLEAKNKMDESDSYSDYQTKFPWYSNTDKDVGRWSNSNRSTS